MGDGRFFSSIFILILLQLLRLSSSLPLCTDSRAPLIQKVPLKFCPYNGTSCCNSSDDLQLQNQFGAMNISEPTCAALLKSILCSKCDQFSGELFKVDSVPRQVPVLCNSTIEINATRINQSPTSFCSSLWNTCQNVSIMNSPFSASIQSGVGRVKSNFTKLTDAWQSQNDFCNAFGGVSGNESVCFDGRPVNFNGTAPPNPPNGMCLEKIGNGSYLNMVAHPDGSGRAFFSNQAGKIWLATVPEQGSGQTLGIDETDTFLDLTDEVHFDSGFGMMGIAAHPKFATNGRFFVSYNCDKTKWPGCGGRCSCNSDVKCDPSKLPSDSGSSPCQYQSVVAEYTVNGTAPQPSLAKNAQPTEVRRIFTMGLPFTGHHAGQILFGPEDGYLYFMMGDGGSSGDPYNFSQNKKSLLGKVMRLDVDNIPNSADMAKLGLWGNYSIPKDNPYTEDKDLQPEIWALGLRNPWRCSFDSLRPSYFLCADVGQDLYEEVNIITKDGNYGWRIYEGPYTYIPQNSSERNSSTSGVNPIFPVMGYNHSTVNKNEGSASITGGYFYRSTTDPCMYGRYLFTDLYAGAVWSGIENPENSGNFTSNEIPFSCAADSPIKCTFPSAGSNSLPALGYIFSFGEDNNKDVYLLASSGVYRVVRPSRCKYVCSKENASAEASPAPAASNTPSDASFLMASNFCLLILVFSSLWFLILLSIV